MAREQFSEDDVRQLLERGIPLAEAERQLELFERPVRYVDLVRPCTVGDGIERIADEAIPGLLVLHAAAAQAGRFRKFVPASGVASRMFHHLLYFQRGPGRELCWQEIERRAAEGAGEAAALVDFLRSIDRLAIYPELKKTLFGRGEDLDGLARVGAFQPVLDALLGPGGMGCAERPKALLKFHAYPEGPRTPFEEQLVEAAGYVKDGEGRCRLHFTVAPEQREGFERLFRAVEQPYGRLRSARFDIDYSVQKPATDTLVVAESGQPLRDAAGRLQLRPAGHGALIGNLNDLLGDLVYVKNIDNVQPERLQPLVQQWKKLLGGYLVELQDEVFDCLNRLREPDPAPALVEQAERVIGRRLHVRLDARQDPPTFQARRASLIGRLSRPLRVAGVVRNTGEPGGGPFWVRGADGSVTRQIVEAAQVDPSNAEQQRILRSATHFNPVDLVCGVRDAQGGPFDLGRFVDPDAVIVTRKSEGGRELRVLERPGLWNGGMAGWNTVFVEVPLETFSPVKSLLDLLRPEHRV